MKREMRKEMQIGLLLLAVFLILKQFTNTHHAILGVVAGLALAFEIVGSLPQNTYDKLIYSKKKLLNKN